MDYNIKSRIWIEADGHILLGEGRIALLKAIKESGSLSKAAKSIGMSYKKAWSLMDAVNKRAKQPVMTSNIGGKGGGGAQLTSYGETLIDVFESINQKCWEFLDNQLKEANL